MPQEYYATMRLLQILVQGILHGSGHGYVIHLRFVDKLGLGIKFGRHKRKGEAPVLV